MKILDRLKEAFECRIVVTKIESKEFYAECEEAKRELKIVKLEDNVFNIHAYVDNKEKYLCTIMTYEGD